MHPELIILIVEFWIGLLDLRSTLDLYGFHVKSIPLTKVLMCTESMIFNYYSIFAANIVGVHHLYIE